MFKGEYEHSVDEKGRMLIPTKFRAKLGEGFVVTKGLESCLYIYTMEEWAKFEEKLNALPFSSKDARNFTRFFLSGAEDAEIDGQGRARLPGNLREYAGIEKQITSVGVGNRIEVWDTEKWKKYNEDESFDASDLAEKMAGLGI